MDTPKTKLSELVTVLASSLEKHVAVQRKDPRLNERCNDWIKHHGLGRKLDANVTLTKQVALNITLKTIIYEAVRDFYGLEKLSGSNIRKLRQLINQLYETSQIPVLSESLLDDLLGDQYFVIAPFLEQVHESINEIRSVESDVIGKIYEEIVLQEERRRLGQFWTPGHISEFMVHWSIKDKKK